MQRALHRLGSSEESIHACRDIGSEVICRAEAYPRVPAPVHVHDVMNSRARSLVIDTFKFDRELILEVPV